LLCHDGGAASERVTHLLGELYKLMLPADPVDRHMFGSRNVGNNKADIKAAMELVRNVYKQLGMKLDESEMKWTSKLDSWK